MVPIPWVPNLQVQGHLPTSKTGMRNPEDGTPCEIFEGRMVEVGAWTFSEREICDEARVIGS